MRHLDAAEPQLDDRAKLWTCSEALEQARTYDGPSGVEALLAHAERMVDELGLTRSRQILREMGRYQPRCVRPRTRARQPRPCVALEAGLALQAATLTIPSRREAGDSLIL